MVGNISLTFLRAAVGVVTRYMVINVLVASTAVVTDKSKS